MRIISMQEGSDVGKVLDRLVRGVKVSYTWTTEGADASQFLKSNP